MSYVSRILRVQMFIPAQIACVFLFAILGICLISNIARSKTVTMSAVLCDEKKRFYWYISILDNYWWHIMVVAVMMSNRNVMPQCSPSSACLFELTRGSH